MGIGKNLRDLIALKGTNVNELAVKSEISPQTLYAIIKRDNSKIDTLILLKLSAALGVPSEEILSFTDRYDIPDTDSEEYILGNVEDSTSIKILADIKLLNEEGKKEAEKRIEELTHLHKYTE